MNFGCWNNHQGNQEGYPRGNSSSSVPPWRHWTTQQQWPMERSNNVNRENYHQHYPRPLMPSGYQPRRYQNQNQYHQRSSYSRDAYRRRFLRVNHQLLPPLEPVQTFDQLTDTRNKETTNNNNLDQNNLMAEENLALRDVRQVADELTLPEITPKIEEDEDGYSESTECGSKASDSLVIDATYADMVDVIREESFINDDDDEEASGEISAKYSAKDWYEESSKKLKITLGSEDMSADNKEDSEEETVEAVEKHIQSFNKAKNVSKPANKTVTSRQSKNDCPTTSKLPQRVSRKDVKENCRSEAAEALSKNKKSSEQSKGRPKQPDKETVNKSPQDVAAELVKTLPEKDNSFGSFLKQKDTDALNAAKVAFKKIAERRNSTPMKDVCQNMTDFKKPVKVTDRRHTTVTHLKDGKEDDGSNKANEKPLEDRRPMTTTPSKVDVNNIKKLAGRRHTTTTHVEDVRESSTEAASSSSTIAALEKDCQKGIGSNKSNGKPLQERRQTITTPAKGVNNVKKLVGRRHTTSTRVEDVRESSTANSSPNRRPARKVPEKPAKPSKVEYEVRYMDVMKRSNSDTDSNVAKPFDKKIPKMTFKRRSPSNDISIDSKTDSNVAKISDYKIPKLSASSKPMESSHSNTAKASDKRISLLRPSASSKPIDSKKCSSRDDKSSTSGSDSNMDTTESSHSNTAKASDKRISLLRKSASSKPIDHRSRTSGVDRSRTSSVDRSRTSSVDRSRTSSGDSSKTGSTVVKASDKKLSLRRPEALSKPTNATHRERSLSKDKSSRSSNGSNKSIDSHSKASDKKPSALPKPTEPSSSSTDLNKSPSEKRKSDSDSRPIVKLRKLNTNHEPKPKSVPVQVACETTFLPVEESCNNILIIHPEAPQYARTCLAVDPLLEPIVVSESATVCNDSVTVKNVQTEPESVQMKRENLNSWDADALAVIGQLIEAASAIEQLEEATSNIEQLSEAASAINQIGEAASAINQLGEAASNIEQLAEAALAIDQPVVKNENDDEDVLFVCTYKEAAKSQQITQNTAVDEKNFAELTSLSAPALENRPVFVQPEATPVKTSISNVANVSPVTSTPTTKPNVIQDRVASSSIGTTLERIPPAALPNLSNEVATPSNIHQPLVPTRTTQRVTPMQVTVPTTGYDPRNFLKNFSDGNPSSPQSLCMSPNPALSNAQTFIYGIPCNDFSTLIELLMMNVYTVAAMRSTTVSLTTFREKLPNYSAHYANRKNEFWDREKQRLQQQSLRMWCDLNQLPIREMNNLNAASVTIVQRIFETLRERPDVAREFTNKINVWRILHNLIRLNLVMYRTVPILETLEYLSRNALCRASARDGLGNPRRPFSRETWEVFQQQINFYLTTQAWVAKFETQGEQSIIRAPMYLYPETGVPQQYLQPLNTTQSSTKKTPKPKRAKKISTAADNARQQQQQNPSDAAIIATVTTVERYCFADASQQPTEATKSTTKDAPNVDNAQQQLEPENINNNNPEANYEDALDDYDEDMLWIDLTDETDDGNPKTDDVAPIGNPKPEEDVKEEEESQVAVVEVNPTCHCGGEPKYRCNLCKNAYYCSVDCQEGDWADHRHNCVFDQST